MAVVMSEKEIRRLLNEMRGYKPDYSSHLYIAESKIAVASDVHVPYHHTESVARFIKVAEANEVEAIVWLGDFLDNPIFSSWGNEDLRTTFKEELEQVKTIIEIAAQAVDRQYWSIGNHEYRWMRRMGYQGDMEMLARMAGLERLMDERRLVVTDDPTLGYDNGSHWMLTHPAQYGTTPLKVPGELAERYGTNIISAHAHHWGMGISPSGRYTVIESGGLFDASKVKYVQHRVTTHRAWVRGFVLLDNGEPTLVRG